MVCSVLQYRIYSIRIVLRLLLLVSVSCFFRNLTENAIYCGMVCVLFRSKAMCTQLCWWVCGLVYSFTVLFCQYLYRCGTLTTSDTPLHACSVCVAVCGNFVCVVVRTAWWLFFTQILFDIECHLNDLTLKYTHLWAKHFFLLL